MSLAWHYKEESEVCPLCFLFPWNKFMKQLRTQNTLSDIHVIWSTHYILVTVIIFEFQKLKIGCNKLKALVGGKGGVKKKKTSVPSDSTFLLQQNYTCLGG